MLGPQLLKKDVIKMEKLKEENKYQKIGLLKK